ncbi:hypothetical protein NMK97_12025 [Bacillus amyloliquefaciens]|nr:hypothetical protein NMK97_12025 [Bacillus amyloliquefaciens]
MFAIISAGIAPGIALLSYFYLKDQYDNEPVHMVLRSFFLGVVLVFPTMFIQYVLEKEHVGRKLFRFVFVFGISGRIGEMVRSDDQCVSACSF